MENEALAPTVLADCHTVKSFTEYVGRNNGNLLDNDTVARASAAATRLLDNAQQSEEWTRDLVKDPPAEPEVAPIHELFDALDTDLRSVEVDLGTAEDKLDTLATRVDQLADELGKVLVRLALVEARPYPVLPSPPVYPQPSWPQTPPGYPPTIITCESESAHSPHGDCSGFRAPEGRGGG